MGLFIKSEREKWATPLSLTSVRGDLGLPGLDGRSQELYGRLLPRGVAIPRFYPDRPPVNYWMRPGDLSAMSWVPGQLIMGKFAGRMIGHLDDRPMVTIAGSRSGKSSTVLEPNLYAFPGSMIILDGKGELAASSALIRAALGHDVFVLDPFGISGLETSSFNALDELDADSDTVVDDVSALTHAIIVDDGGGRERHWNETARELLLGVSLLTLTLPARMGRDLVSVRQFLTLTHPHLVAALRSAPKQSESGKPDEDYYEQNKHAVETLLKVMASDYHGYDFGEILSGIGKRFLSTPHTERGSIFSTAAAQTDFLDSMRLRRISRSSDFSLADLRSNRPTTIYVCVPEGRMGNQFRWMRMLVQLACTVLEQMGPYPRTRTPIVLMAEEFASLQHMTIMERAAAYLPGFGVKLWAVLQDITQLQRYYSTSWETFLGNAGIVQCFANGDQQTLEYISRRLERLIAPFELRTAFSRERFTQILMMEGQPPAAAIRLEHSDVANIRAWAIARAWERHRRQGQ